jgi:hypothetical protein
MIIGLDFDNTIVCYAKAIKILAEKKFELPPEVARTKLGVRDFLRSIGREKEWTAFQGELYGPGMCFAEPFDGAIATMQKLEAEGHNLVIVSHRSRLPYAGEPHDLHAAALEWVSQHLRTAGLFTNKSLNSSNSDCVHFLETKDRKLAKIAEAHCDLFLDDLPEIILSPKFPASTIGILFDSANIANDNIGKLRISSWDQLPTQLSKAP